MKDYKIPLKSQEILASNKLFDLEYFDGPLKSIYYINESTLCVFSWLKAKENSNLWLKFYTHPVDVSKYIYKKISFLELLKNSISNLAYKIEIDENLNHFYIRKMETNLENLQGYDYFFEEDLCEDIDLIQHWEKEINSKNFIYIEKAERTCKEYKKIDKNLTPSSLDKSIIDSEIFSSVHRTLSLENSWEDLNIFYEKVA